MVISMREAEFIVAAEDYFAVSAERAYAAIDSLLAMMSPRRHRLLSRAGALVYIDRRGRKEAFARDMRYAPLMRGCAAQRTSNTRHDTFIEHFRPSFSIFDRGRADSRFSISHHRRSTSPRIFEKNANEEHTPKQK